MPVKHFVRNSTENIITFVLIPSWISTVQYFEDSRKSFPKHQAHTRTFCFAVYGQSVYLQFACTSLKATRNTLTVSARLIWKCYPPQLIGYDFMLNGQISVNAAHISLSIPLAFLISTDCLHCTWLNKNTHFAYSSSPVSEKLMVLQTKNGNWVFFLYQWTNEPKILDFLLYFILYFKQKTHCEILAESVIRSEE